MRRLRESGDQRADVAVCSVLKNDPKSHRATGALKTNTCPQLSMQPRRHKMKIDAANCSCIMSVPSSTARSCNILVFDSIIRCELLVFDTPGLC